ncbi:MAG: hypothetical protein RMJ43_01455 [Chloroherpetonaceae bacterium]|nr:hypothetical protein [Chthonomonadaceae bacterium]MDW8206475.1 hypothetical protein [Chloroherpetonaceae bacterium]
METDWALARRGAGVFVLHADGRVTLLEFNAFLRWIAVGAIQDEDCVLSAVYTDGTRRRAADLRVYQMVRAGVVPAALLPLRSGNGVLAEGDRAVKLLRALEVSGRADDRALLRPVGHVEPASYYLRPANPDGPENEVTCLLRPAASILTTGALHDSCLQNRDVPAHPAHRTPGMDG